MTEEEKKLLEAAQQICVKYGYAPLPKATLEALVSTYDVIEVVFDGVSRLKPGYVGLLEGKEITKEVLLRNIEAIDTLEQIATEQKPIYAEARNLVAQLLKMTER